MIFTLLLFFFGFYILIKGANFLVEGSSSLARRFDISNFVIGLVIAGIGTSIPEFAITLFANLIGEADIGLGTIIGSATFNILVILGFSALIVPLVLRQEWVERDLIWNVWAVLIAAVFALPFGEGAITRIEGLLMFAFFGLWLYFAIAKSNDAEQSIQEPIRIAALPVALFLILAGLVGVIFGGKWVVDGVEVIARALGMSEALIGLTIVGIGTSLPELAVTFVAALKFQPGIAVGNIIGSNIFNFLMILGAAALVKPIIFPSYLFVDLVVAFLSAAILYGFMYMGEYYILKRWQGLLFLFFYILYLTYLIGRG